MTQEKLAQLAEVSLSQIRNIETSRTTCNIETALRIAKALGVSLDKLFELD